MRTLLNMFVRISETLFRRTDSRDQEMADMYQSPRVLAIGVVVFLLGVGLGIFAALSLHIAAALGAVACVALGVVAFMCWNNQKIFMITDEIFCYRTFLGNDHEYRFSQIRKAIQNSDSITLVMETGKVHIESSAILSQRLVERIDRELEKKS